MNKKHHSKNEIIIGILTLVILALGSLVVIQLLHPIHKEQILVHYIAYDNQLIEIHSDSKMEISSNLYENKHKLAVLLDSKESPNKLANIMVQVNGEDGSILYKEEKLLPILHHTKAVCSFSLPELRKASIKNIEVYLTDEESGAKTNIVDDPVKGEIKETKENLDTSITVNWNYPKEEIANSMMGGVVLYQEGKIVGVSNFQKENIGKGIFTTNSIFPSELKDGKVTPIPHDQVEAFISYYE